jgi:parvulin-like peptidyl-prolyl isomerase
LTWLAIAAVALAAGCNRPEEDASAAKPPRPGAPAIPAPAPEPERDPREVVARVDDRTLTWGDMEKRARTFYIEESRSILIPEGRAAEAMDFFRRRAVNVFVFKTVMLEEARKRGVTVTAADRLDGSNRMARAIQRQRGVTLETFFKESPFGESAARQEFEDGLVVEKLLKQEVADKVTVGDKEIDALAEEIILDRAAKRKRIEALRAQLLAGADFAKLAAEHSDCESRSQGGDLGQLPRGRMLPALDQALFSQPIGEIGPVIETEAGFHVVKVTARHAKQPAKGGAPALPESAQASHILVKTRPVLTRLKLSDEVRRTKYNRAVQEYYGALKKGRRIESIYKDLVL